MAWLNQSNRTLDGGYGYFVNRTASIAVQQGRRPVQWNEVGPTATHWIFVLRLGNHGFDARHTAVRYRVVS